MTSLSSKVDREYRSLGDVENQKIFHSVGTPTHDHTHDRRNPYQLNDRRCVDLLTKRSFYSVLSVFIINAFSPATKQVAFLHSDILELVMNPIVKPNQCFSVGYERLAPCCHKRTSGYCENSSEVRNSQRCEIKSGKNPSSSSLSKRTCRGSQVSYFVRK